MRQPYQVLVYLARPGGAGPDESRWEYLLLRRNPGLGGFWQGVTGALEEGESFAQAARRELLEETGLMPDALVQIGFSYSFSIQDQWRPLYPPGVEEIVEHVYVALAAEGAEEPALSHEHDAWQWCTLMQALELLTWPENVEALKRCDEWLRSGAAS